MDPVLEKLTAIEKLLARFVTLRRVYATHWVHSKTGQNMLLINEAESESESFSKGSEEMVKTNMNPADWKFSMVACKEMPVIVIKDDDKKEEAPLENFVHYLQYAADKYAQNPKQKNAVYDIITNIKQTHADTR